MHTNVVKENVRERRGMTSDRLGACASECGGLNPLPFILSLWKEAGRNPLALPGVFAWTIDSIISDPGLIALGRGV